jgi:lipopolysaccharide export system permease protein
VIINRYLARQIIGPMVLIVVLLIALFATYSLTRFLTDAATGLLNLTEVLRITALRGIIALEVLIPISLYVAVVVGLGRLYSEYEMDALRSAGVSRANILRPILGVAIAVAIVAWLFSLVLRPWAYQSIYQLEAEAEAGDELQRIKPGQFYHYDAQDRTVFVRALGKERDELLGVFVRTRQDDSVEVIASATGRVREYVTPTEHELVLRNARIFRADRSDFNLFGEFDEFRLMLPAGVVAVPPYKSKSATTAELAVSLTASDRAEYQWRLSTGLSTLLLALLAVPLSHSLPRQGRYAKLMIAIAIYASYYILIGVARTWVEQDQRANLWWVPGLLGGFVVLLYAPWRRGEF